MWLKQDPALGLILDGLSLYGYLKVQLREDEVSVNVERQI